MIGSKALTMAVAAVVLIGGMAAVGAAAPADQASDNATDAYEEHASDDGDANEADVGPADATPTDADANASPESVGPSGGLPDQVPDHVSQIHDAIQSSLDGSIDDLGQTLSDLLGSNGSPTA